MNNQEIKIRGGTACCVPGCNSRSRKNRNIPFHFFPKDKQLFDIWVARINRRIEYKALGKDILWTPTKSNKMCGLHFNRSGKKRSVDLLPRFFPDRTYPLIPYQKPLRVVNANKMIVKSKYEFQNQQSVNNNHETLVVEDSGSEDRLFHSYCLPVTPHGECATIIKNLKFEIIKLKEKETLHLAIIEESKKNENELLAKISEYEQQFEKTSVLESIKIEKIENDLSY